MNPHRTEIEVRGYELDSFGHVNHAVYVQYYEHARWKMLADHGIDRAALDTGRCWPVIAEIEIRYLKPTFLGDRLEVRTTIEEAGRTHFRVRQEIYRDDTRVSDARVQVVTVNENGRPTPFSPPFEAMVKS